MTKQSEINIGMVGHVDHGKTTLTQALSGVWTDTHSEEIRRGISIKLGYADATFRKCPVCPDPQCYTTKEICKHCGSKTEFLRKVSFVDSPGHETLMAVMLSGASLMDGAVLVIAANEPCPQPQTKEHLMALEIIGVKNVVIAQNKVELVSEKEARENYEQILKFIEGTVAEGAPIIPISAQNEVNIDVLIMAIEEKIPTPKRDPSKPVRMYVARSFDVNKPGTKIDELVGGVIGGSIIQGVLRIGDEIEIKPGVGDNPEEPLYTEVVSLRVPDGEIEEARPGGLVGVGTELDPSLTKSDNLIGRVAGKPGTLPQVLRELDIEIHLLEKVVGLTEETKVEPLKRGEQLMINVGTSTTIGNVVELRKDEAVLRLLIPVCAQEGDRAALSRRIMGRWRLVGYGIVQ